MTTIELLTAEEVCKALKISRATLYNLISRKAFPPGIRQGRKMYWPKTDLDVYLAKQLRERTRRRKPVTNL